MTTSLMRRTRIFLSGQVVEFWEDPEVTFGWAREDLRRYADREEWCCCSTIERLGHRYALQNPRIVNLKAAERRLPGALRPFFRAADFPGYVLLDEAPQTSSRARSGAA